MPHGVEALVGVSLGGLATAQRRTGAHGLSWRAECGYNLRRFAFDQRLALDWADIKTALFCFCVLASGPLFGACKLRVVCCRPWARQAGPALRDALAECRAAGRACAADGVAGFGAFFDVLKRACTTRGFAACGFLFFGERGDLRAGQRAQGR